jgi:hypothetical protein
MLSHIPIVQFGQVNPRRNVIRNLVVQLNKPRLAHPHQRHVHVGIGKHVIEQQPAHIQDAVLAAAPQVNLPEPPTDNDVISSTST